MSFDYSLVESRLWPRGGDRDVWMIVDPSRDRRLYFDLINSHFEYSCLYSGPIPEELEAVAPHLVQLVYDDRETKEFVTRAWGRAWGVFLRCPLRVERVRRHLRTFLQVNDWRGRKMLFRYYDPRVLRAYLPTCAAEELSTVYGPVTHFWTEGETRGLLEFAFERGRMIRTEAEVGE